MNDEFDPTLWRQMIYERMQEMQGIGDSDWAKFVRLANAMPFGSSEHWKSNANKNTQLSKS